MKVYRVTVKTDETDEDALPGFAILNVIKKALEDVGVPVDELIVEETD